MIVLGCIYAGIASPTEDTVTQLYAEKFAEKVEKRSDGSMKITVYPNSVLGGDRELLESWKDGDIPFVVQNTAPQVSFLKDTAVFDIPAVFETIENSGTEILTPDEIMYEEIRELCKPIYKVIEQSVSEEIVKAYIGE